MYSIEITTAVNGVSIVVGCKKFVFNDIDEATIEINRYLKNPKAVIKEYEKKYGFSLREVRRMEPIRETEPMLNQNSLEREIGEGR